MKETLITAALEGGNILKKLYKKSKEVRYKEKGNIVSIQTKADILSEKKIISIIKNKFPAHNIISEESKPQNKGSDYTWIIDPMDGTQNFVLGFPEFGVSIGLLKNSTIIMATVYLPILDEFYLAQKGKGSTLNGKKIKVTDKKDLKGSTIAANTEGRKTKYGLDYKIIEKTRFFKTASAVTCASFVASGRFDGYITIGMHPWDIAATSLIVRESGGHVSDLEGNKLRLESDGMIASNKYIHKELIGYIIKNENNKNTLKQRNKILL